MGFTHSIWFNRFLRHIYRNLPLSWHVKQRLKDIYLGRTNRWKVAPKSVFQGDGSREALVQVAKGAARFDCKDRWILIADIGIPVPDWHPDFLRRAVLLDFLQENGFRITLACHSPELLSPHPRVLKKQDADVLSGFDAIRHHLMTEGAKYHFVLLSGSAVACRYLPYARAHSLYSTIIYEAVERSAWLGHEIQLSSGTASADAIAHCQRTELLNVAVACADQIIVPTDDVRSRLLMKQPDADITVLPYIHESHPASTSFTQRQGLLLIEDAWSKSDMDAVISFVESVLPRITEKLAEVVLYIVGRTMPASIKALRSTNVEPVDLVEDVAPYLESCRLLVMPPGVGTGTGNVIRQGMSHGLPVVSSSIGTAGMCFQHEKHLLLAETRDDLVSNVIRLYSDHVLWHRLSVEALAYMTAHYSAEAARGRMADIFNTPRSRSCFDESSERDHTNPGISDDRRHIAMCGSTQGNNPVNDLLEKQKECRVLVIGIYLADKGHLAHEIIRELAASGNWRIEQHWVSLGKQQPDQDMRPFTTQIVDTSSPKFSLLNRILENVDLTGFEYLIVSDDDIQLPAGFLDRYLALVSHHDFAVAQPARTHDSYIDHWFVEQLDGIDARRTRFVEIGPLFSFHRTAFDHFLPFDETSPMGWGVDFVWPVWAERAGLRMGVIDAVPVAHSLRKPVAYYDYGISERAMAAYLANHPHLSKDDAFHILQSYV